MCIVRAKWWWLFPAVSSRSAYKPSWVSIWPSKLGFSHVQWFSGSDQAQVMFGLKLLGCLWLLSLSLLDLITPTNQSGRREIGAWHNILSYCLWTETEDIEQHHCLISQTIHGPMGVIFEDRMHTSKKY